MSDRIELESDASEAPSPWIAFRKTSMVATSRLSVALLSAVAFSAATPCAQVKPHETTIPAAFTGSIGPPGAYRFFGRSRGLLQQWYRADGLRAGSISSIGILENFTGPAITHKLEITLANTRTGFAMSKTFRQNLGSAPVTWFRMKNASWPAVRRVGPNQSHSWLSGDRPFMFSGPHLIVQWDIQTSTKFGMLARRENAGQYQLPFESGRSGRSCGAASLDSSYSGSTLQLILGPVPTNRPALIFAGFSSAWSGSFRLPFDLGPLGYTNCTLNVDPLLAFPVSTTSGVGRLRLPIPIPKNDTYVIHSQGFFADSSKPSGFALSNATWSLLGNRGQCNYMLNWSRDGPTAQYGPYNVNSSVILLVRP